MKHYMPHHEPQEWPFWHDLVICGVVLFILGLLAGCGPSEEHQCINQGSVVVLADPTDNNTEMIGCVSPEEYSGLTDSYKVEISDD